MKYEKALTILRQYDKKYSQKNDILKSVICILNDIMQDSQNESKEDLIEWINVVKKDLYPKKNKNKFN